MKNKIDKLDELLTLQSQITEDLCNSLNDIEMFLEDLKFENSVLTNRLGAATHVIANLMGHLHINCDSYTDAEKFLSSLGNIGDLNVSNLIESRVNNPDPVNPVTEMEDSSEFIEQIERLVELVELQSNATEILERRLESASHDIATIANFSINKEDYVKNGGEPLLNKGLTRHEK